MTDNGNYGMSGGKEGGRCKEKKPSERFRKASFWRKCLVGTVLVFVEWKLGRGGRPMDVRLQELIFLFVLCRVAFCDAKTGRIPTRFVKEIFALASAGFL